MSKIEWTEKTWNPVTGCTKISRGCLNCYAKPIAERLKLNKVKQAQKARPAACVAWNDVQDAWQYARETWNMVCFPQQNGDSAHKRQCDVG